MHNIKQVLSRVGLALLISASAPLMAATYYVDAAMGNDGWNGVAPIRGTAGSGPWKTLNRVARANLVAGDQVLLRCGQTWSTTLKLNGSGTAEQPIRVGTYPAACSDKPVISGYRTIPENAWQLHRGGIYRVTLPLNQVSNGSLETSVSGWKRFSADNSAVLSFDSACPASTTGCLRITSGSSRRQANIAISPTFPLEEGVGYVAEVSVRAPQGVRYGVVVRRNGPSFETLGLSSGQGGTGAWQRIRLPFQAVANVANARFEVEFHDPSTSLHIKQAAVTLQQQPLPLQLSDAGEPVNVAHHPNPGSDPTWPRSVYLPTADRSTVATVNGRRVSTDVVVGNMRLPPDVTVTPGLRLHLRENGWRVDEHTVTAVVGNRLSISPPTSYPMFQGNWGYYLTGALWMLDSPGEWHHDTTDGNLYLWPADGRRPGANVRYGALNQAIDLVAARHITIEGLRVEGVRQGIDLQDAVGVQLRDIEIVDTLDDGIRAIGSVDALIEDSRFERMGGDAIHAPYSNGLRVVGNDIRDNGVLWRNGRVVNLPKTTYAAIRAGHHATVSNNRIENIGYIGIWPEYSSRVVGNAVINSCTVLNDCGGIYLPATAYETEVSGNLLDTAPGNTDGLFPTLPAHSAGLYFDEQSRDVIASNNTITGYVYGSQIHNSWNIALEDNTFFGNRGFQLLLQEQRNFVRADGDTHNNLVRNNRFFPTNEGTAVHLLSNRTTTYDFGRFEGNRYSNLYSPMVLVETQPGNLRTVNTLRDWQTASVAGVPRQQDVGARAAAPLPGQALGLTGPSLIWNGDFSAGRSSWSSSSSAPAAVLAVADCSPAGPARCLAVTTGGGLTSVGTPRFSINDQWYRVSFDVRADRDNTPLWAVVRRAGTVSFANLMPSSVGVTAGVQWKRYSFNFKSTARVSANEAPGVLGARLDFEQMPAGRTIWLANVEMVPLSPSDGSASLTESFLLRNPEASTISLDCPLRSTQPARCASFVQLDDGALVTWPVVLDPMASRIVFAQDLSLPDADRDGIADTQDRCPATPDGSSVNARGCAFGEIPAG